MIAYYKYDDGTSLWRHRIL